MTAYEPNLYKLRDISSPSNQAVEKSIFQAVDSQAAEALSFIERKVERQHWPEVYISAWTRFMMSLMCRMPEDISDMRKLIRLDIEDISATEEKEYQSLRKPDDPPNFRAFVEEAPERFFERWLFKLIKQLHDSEDIGLFVNNMHWTTIDATQTEREFITSDRPLIITYPLQATDGHWALPIGPRKLFLAANNLKTISRIKEISHRQLVGEVNSQTVMHAVRYCYARTEDQLRLIQNKFASGYQERSLHKLVIMSAKQA
jgi:hypothetical protein